MKRILLSASLAFLCLALAFSLAPGAGAQTPEPEFLPGPQVVIYADSEPSTLRIPAPNLGPQLNAVSITVEYVAGETLSGTYYSCSTPSASAQTAMNYALSIWGSYLNSSTPIRIAICWRNLGTGILGSSGPLLVSGFANQPVANTYYPLALANYFAGSDLNGSSAGSGYEMTGRFNTSFNWYFGTDGYPAYNQIDFASVALHELGHGLGMVGSMSNNTGTLLYNSPPFIYDRFTENADGIPLLSLPNGSAELTSALTSGSYFAGVFATASNYSNPVQLYTPSTWQPGSSYSHVAESFNGTENTLMTWSLAYAEVVHNPGPITLCILADIGWSVSGCAPIAPSGLTAVTSSSTPLSQINLAWTDNSSNETGFQIERSTDGSTWSLIYTTAANATSYSNTGLASGARYYYRVRATNTGGSSAYTATANAVTFGLTALATGENRILLTWTDYSSSETGYRIERSPNGSTSWVTITTTAANATSYTNTGLEKSTRYYYRVYGLNITQVYTPTASATTWTSTSRVFLPSIHR